MESLRKTRTKNNIIALVNLKKIKKGITLLELVITIAVSSVIFVGVSGLLVFLNRTNTALRIDAENYFSCNTLSHSIEMVLDEGNSNLNNLPEEKTIFDDESKDAVSDVNSETKKLFSVETDENTTNYYFVNQHFGYTVGNDVAFTKIYQTESRMKLEIDPKENGVYVFTIYYGEEYEGSISFMKKLAIKGV